MQRTVAYIGKLLKGVTAIILNLGTVVVAVQVPIFVKGHRYDAASCGWDVSNGTGSLPPPGFTRN